ncbi:MAG: protein phosphatase 2C domain-containing protein [Desulfobacterales bacterium]|jgi:protein phosphatase|nr:protein phosphatase 2C domain-containing protein [Desulfobacterales bacterium]
MDYVESAGLTDVGLKRKENQDALLIDDGLGLYMVSDGMGGHQAGEVASRLTIEAIIDVIGHHTFGSLEAADTSQSLSRHANLLIHAISAANQKVYQAARENAVYQGMGATVSAVLFTEKTFIAANVGDSPIYLIHKGRIEKLSVAHTLVAEHAAAEPKGKTQLSPSYRHVLTRAVGTRETVQSDVCELQRFPGDILVIGSDGLSNRVEMEEIRQIAQQFVPTEACRRLIDLANQRGGDDNVTVIVIKTPPKPSFLISIIKRFNQLLWRD